jgi:hypothetical protein
MMVWVCVSREGGLLEDVEVFRTEDEAADQVARWAEDMEAVHDGDVGGTVYYDDNQNDWYFDIWPKHIAAVAK